MELHGAHGWWMIAQQQLTSQQDDPCRGLSVFASVTLPEATSFIDSYQQVGLVYKNPFASRPKDDIGLALARIHVNLNG